MTPEQATEILQRVTRIETMCEGRCSTAQESREDLHEEIRRLRSDMEKGQDRLEDKLDRAISGLTEKQDEMKDSQWRDRLKLAGVGVGGGGAGATIMMLIQYFAGGGK